MITGDLTSPLVLDILSFHWILFWSTCVFLFHWGTLPVFSDKSFIEKQSLIEAERRFYKERNKEIVEELMKNTPKEALDSLEFKVSVTVYIFSVLYQSIWNFCYIANLGRLYWYLPRQNQKLSNHASLLISMFYCTFTPKENLFCFIHVCICETWNCKQIGVFDRVNAININACTLMLNNKIIIILEGGLVLTVQWFWVLDLFIYLIIHIVYTLTARY